jgi:glycosyltransferase involved in cell wall biosynthesis
MMPELLIDTTRLATRTTLLQSPTGIDRVCLAYVRQYGDRSRAVLHTGRFHAILPKGPSADLFSLLLEPDQTTGRRISSILARALLLSWRERDVAGSLLLNLGHSGPEKNPYARWLRSHSLRAIFMLHDLIPVTHPEFCRPLEYDRHAKRVESVLRHATAVLTNSTSTLKVLSEYADRCGFPLPPTLAVPLAGSAMSGEVGDRPMQEPYFVMLSTIEPRKNHWMILQVWRRLIERLGAAAPRLVVIGRRGWECENVLDMLDRSDLLRGYVLERNQCSDSQVKTYLYHCNALLFPSFVEGYGLPLVEALSMGVPAIASDLPVFHEIVGEIPEYLDPLDGLGWMRCIESFTEVDSEVRSDQLLRMQVFRAPTWGEHFSKFERLVERIC